MTRTTVGNLIGGVMLVGLGMFFLLLQLVPGLGVLVRMDLLWPFIVIGVGMGLLGAAVFARTPPLAIPGSIVSGIGSLLLVQNLTGYWESWAFVWTLIPGFVGIGLILSGLLGQDPTHALHSGVRLLAISAILFVVFGAFLGPFALGRFWPVLLILAGFVLVGRQLLTTQTRSGVIR
jgi:hypothetical protein